MAQQNVNTVDVQSGLLSRTVSSIWNTTPAQRRLTKRYYENAEKSDATGNPITAGTLESNEETPTLERLVSEGKAAGHDDDVQVTIREKLIEAQNDMRRFSVALSNDYAYIAGGKHIPEPEETDLEHPLRIVDFDLPLTLVHKADFKGHEYILVKFVEGDSENPFNWSKARKYYITSLLCLMTLTIGLATTAYASTIISMCDDLGCSIEVGELGLFLFNISCAFAPLFLAPFCELVGRKVVYVGAYTCFTLCFIGLALGKNVATILVLRFLLGLFGCVGTILVGGTFSDMFHENERAIPMAWFSFVAIIGTVGAPIYAGFIDETIGWRWVEGIQGMVEIPLLIVLAFTFQETRGGVTLSRRARLLRESTDDERYEAESDLYALTIKDMLHESSVKAIYMLFTEPVVFAFGLWIAFTWFITFLFLSVVAITFREKRGWSEGVSGLPWISMAVGVTLAFALGFFQIRHYKRLAKESPEGKVVPEKRLYAVMYGGFLLPLGLFLFAFTQYGFLPWIAPTISLAPIGAGIYFVFEATYSYTSDCYGESSGSATAGQSFLRNTLGAISPLFAAQLFHGMGSQYAGLLLAIIAVILTIIPYAFFVYGDKLRARSKLAHVF